MSAKLERLAEQLAALGSPVRPAILRLVVQGDVEGTVVGDLRGRRSATTSNAGPLWEDRCKGGKSDGGRCCRFFGDISTEAETKQNQSCSA